ncbi:MAG: MBL fold metallo-hydrolase [Kutzneria sp.]|nr:MBL fold metallo-hydrolase [Kutzneria sp.]
MRLTKYAHSCVRIQGDGVLVIDPGSLSEREALDGVDAVLITHEHFDHLDVDALTDAVAKRPSIAIYTHPDVISKLTDLADVVHPVVTGEEFIAAGFTVRTFGGLHAVVHPDLPPVANLGFHVAGQGGSGGVYHPGDSFDVPSGVEVETLFVPVSGPFLKLADAIDFVRAVGPRRAFALHDGLHNDIGNQVSDHFLTELSRSDYVRLPTRATVDLAEQGVPIPETVSPDRNEDS